MFSQLTNLITIPYGCADPLVTSNYKLLFQSSSQSQKEVLQNLGDNFFDLQSLDPHQFGATSKKTYMAFKLLIIEHLVFAISRIMIRKLQ